MSYSIFGGKAKRHIYLPEGEPPPKHLATEENNLIKKLSRNQLNTHTNLSKELQHEKSFAPNSDVYTNLTTYFKGQNSLEEFQLNAALLEQDEQYRKLGLSEQDISILKSFTLLPKSEFYHKYSAVNQEVLDEQIKKILSLVHQTKSDTNAGTSLTRQNNDCETTFLPDLAKEFSSTLEDFGGNQTKKHSLKKIRKKARALGNDITQLNSEKPHLIGPQPCPNTEPLNKNSLWDLSEEPVKIERNIGCKTLKLYTIKNGNIVEFNNEVEQLTVEEIRKIPKFSNYSTNSPSSKLFVKNLRHGFKEDFLKNILQKHFRDNCFSIQLMSGKMRGQAFIEFNDEEDAAKALSILNGVVDNGRPIIVQFSDSKKPK